MNAPPRIYTQTKTETSVWMGDERLGYVVGESPDIDALIEEAVFGQERRSRVMKNLGRVIIPTMALFGGSTVAILGEAGFADKQPVGHVLTGATVVGVVSVIVKARRFYDGLSVAASLKAHQLRNMPRIVTPAPDDLPPQ